MATADSIALELHRTARECPIERFQEQSLSVVEKFIPFDTAMWSVNGIDEVGVAPRFAHLYHQPSEVLDAYRKVRGLDVAWRKIVTRPGETLLLNWGAHPVPDERTDTFRNHCRRFGLMNMLSTGYAGPCRIRSISLCLARGDLGAAFSERERQLKERIMPHLMEAWLSNHAWHIHELNDSASSEPDYAIGGSVALVTSPMDIIDRAGPRFLSIVRREWADWLPPKLPPQLSHALNVNGTYLGTRIIVEAIPVGEMLLLAARAKHSEPTLTPRELIVARYAAEGLSYKEIARLLGVSPSTIRGQLHSVYQKLDVRNKTSLSRFLPVP